MRRLSIACLLVLAVGCASKAPPSLSPAGVINYNNTRVIKALDLVRDTVVDANAQAPPLISTATMLKIVKGHRSALLIIHDLPNGWRVSVLTALDESVKNLPDKEAQLIAPYVSLAHTVIQEVAR